MAGALIKNKLRDLRFANAEALFTAICQIWEAIPQDVIDDLCGSFPTGC
jgi:hypothetical protein